MSGLVDFLLARIAEDEGASQAIRDCDYYHGVESDAEDEVQRLSDPARVLAECEAKRRIVELHPAYRGDRIQPVSTNGVDFGCEACHALDRLHNDSLIEALGYCDTLMALALPYADHDDYDESWRP